LKKSISCEYLNVVDQERLVQATWQANNFNIIRTEDPFVDSLIFSVILEHFPKKCPLNSSLAHDALQLLTVKYIYKKLDHQTRIPRNIYYYILCFLHEVLYGVHAIAPASKDEFFIQLVRQFRFHRLPLTFDYIVNVLKLGTTHKDWQKYFTFFYENPSINDIKAKFHFDDSKVNFMALIHKPGDYCCHIEFKIAIIEILLDEMSHKEVEIMIYRLSHQSYFSRILFDRFLENSSVQQLKDIINDPLSNFLPFKSAASSSISLFSEFTLFDLDRYYIYTRNSLKRFSIKDYSFTCAIFGKSTSFINNFLYTKSSLSLANLEMLAEMFKSSKVFSANEINFILHNAPKHSSLFPFEN